MKVILVGAIGGIGRAAYAELSARHEVISVIGDCGDVNVDISYRSCIEAKYRQVGSADGVGQPSSAADSSPTLSYTCLAR